jgi:tetratricopeptide (TPR) repeat protein
MSRNKGILLLVLSAFYSSCASVRVIEPPTFDYPNLLDTFYRKKPGGHFPIIIQKGMNTDPSVSASGYLFYVSDALGSPDIWMRQLRTTVNVPVVEQESVQNSPAISQDGQFLAYVSYDRDPAGDILITKIDPDRIAYDSIRGNAIPNHRASSLSISEYIAASFREMRDGCAGDAAELDPVFSIDRKTLFFASDRCQRGVFRIWSLTLNEKGRPEGRAVPVSSERAIQPSVTARTLVATALDERGLPQGFLLISLETGKSQRIPYRYGGVALRPVLSSDEKELFFLHIDKDTNGDGRLDLNDNSAVHRMSLKNGPVRHVTDSSMPIYSIALSPDQDGGIYYAGYDRNSSRSKIFLSRPDGVIPRKKNALEQYAFAQGFSGNRRQLALESVIQYFSESSEFMLVEYDVLLDLLRGSMDEEDRSRYAEQIRKAEQENPFSEAARMARPGTVAAIEMALRSGRLSELDEVRRKLAISYLRERLVEARIRAGRMAAALSTVQQLNSEDPLYVNRDRTLLIEASLQLRINGDIPDRFRTLLSDPRTEVGLRQRIIQVIYEEANQNRSGLIADPMKESQPILRGLYYIIQGERLFRARRYQEARIRIQEGLKFTGEDNLAYAIGWKLLAAIYDIEQNRQSALDARLRFLKSYNRDWNINVDDADFLRLIDASRSYIEQYRRSAQSIAEEVEDRLDYRFFLIGEIQKTVISERIQLNMVDRNLLAQFCSADSAAALLVRNLGYREYIERYTKICLSVSPYLQGKEDSIALEDAHEVSQLFYMVSYANATLINILFLQFKTAGLFDELHDTWSVYYHRWKTDLAIERLKRQLIWEEKRSRIISRDTVQSLFREKDPFDAKIFNEIEYGYKFAEPDGRRYFDHSLLYGYAYLLIRKTEERERFYDSLLKQGVQIPSSVMAQRKKAMLDDLKQAEYRLLYILNVDPGYVDATLLLSWLYQYIDYRKQSEVLLEPGYIDRIFIFLTGIKPSVVRDGIFYQEQYQNTFSGRYYEKNVEMLRAAIAAVEESESMKRGEHDLELALLHLNLGNNQFQLVNYRAAAEAYDRVEMLSTRKRTAVFEDDMQKILFHINRGRARFYTGQVEAAARDFDFAVEKLRQSDYWPKFEAANRAAYRALAEPDNAYLKARSERRQNEFVQSRYRLAFVQSLRGLADQAAGNARQAIQAYSDALQILYGREPVPDRAMDKAGLENYIAIAFQELEDFERSDLAAREAEESSKEQGLKRNDNRFQPQTVGGRILGLLLGYGEDFSVIGEGRNPYGFSPLRQFELSLGIRYRNFMRQGDLDRAVEILARRIEVFSKQDGDVRLGREGQVYAFNQRAGIALSQKEFEKAFEDYRLAAEAALKAGMLDSFRRNFRNSCIVLFEQFESTGGDPDLIGRMQAAWKDLELFRQNYRQALKSAYIRQRETEDEGFKYTESKDDPVLERMMIRDMSDFTAIEGMMAFYLHRLMKQAGKADDRNLLSIAEDRLVLASSADAGAPSLAGIRNRLNLARVRLERGQNITPLLERIQEETFEFHAIPERFEYYRILSDIAVQEGRYEAALQQLNQAVLLLVEFPYILSLVADRMHPVFEQMAELEIRLGRPERALRILERARLYALQLEFYRYPLSFPGRDSTELHRLIRQSRSKLRSLLAEETRLRLQRRNTAEVIRLRQEEMKRLEALQKELVLVEPSFRDFMNADPRPLPPAQDAKQYVRLFSTSSSRYCLRLFRGITTVSPDPESCKLTVAPSVIITDWRSAASGMLNAVLQRVGPERVLRTTMSDTSGVMIRSVSDIPAQYRLFNISTDGPGSHENVLQIKELPASNFFARRSAQVFSAADWISQKRRAALALTGFKFDLTLPLKPDQKEDFRRWWEGLMFSYEVFRSSGGGIFLVHGKNLPVDPLLSGREDSLAFGTQGFDRSALREYLIASHSEAMKRGLSKIREDRKAALEEFELADSIIQGLPDASSVGSKNRVHLARSLIIVRPDEGEAYFKKRLAEETQRLERYALYRSYISGLATVGRYDRALAVYEESLREFPEQREKKQSEKIVLEYLSGLNRADPSGPGVSTPDGVNQLFRDDRSLVEAGVQLLYRHGNFDLAGALLTLSKDERITDWQSRIAIESALLRGEGIDEAIALLEKSVLTERDADLNLLLSAYRGRWQYVEDLLNGISISENRSLIEQRKLLYRQLRQRLEESRTGLDSLTCLQGPPAGYRLLNFVTFRNPLADQESACFLLSPTEQLLQLRMALDSIPFDGNDQVKKILYQLIDGVKKQSTQRASLFALLAAKSYLLDQRPNTAAEFLNLYASLSAGRPVPASLAKVQAFTTLWLAALRWKIPQRQIEYSLQTDYGTALFHRVAPVIAMPSSRDTLQAMRDALRDPQFSSEDLLMGLYVLEQKATQARDAELFFDILIARKRLQQGRDWVIPPVAKELKRRIPSGQQITVLHDNGTVFQLLQLTSEGITMTDLPGSSVRLRSRLLEFFQNSQDRESAAALAGEYETMLPGPGRGMNYLWFTGVHALAPLNLSGAKLQIVDPESLLYSSREDGRFRNDFRILLKTRKTADPRNDLYRRTIQNLVDLTNLELMRMNPAASATVLVQQGWEPVSGVSHWMIYEEVDRPVLDLTPGHRQPLLFAFGVAPNVLQQGSGVIGRMPHGGGLGLVPGFVKAYIKADLPPATIQRRFDFARQQIQEGGASYYLFLKPATSAFIEEPMISEAGQQ